MSEGIGHNSTVDGGHLRAFIERVEKLDEERRAIVEDISEVYKEAKGVGFDVKIIKRIVALRKKSADARAEEAELLALYASAIQLDLGI